MAKYLDPKADVTFKKVFGERKNLVISLLTIREPMDYTAWREKHMYLDEDVHSLAERARATARRFDAMNGDYTRLREGVFDGNDVASELDGKISAWKSTNSEPALA